LLTLEDAIRNLHSAGVVVVAAAGNEGTDVVDAIPAAIPEVISVGAVNPPGGWSPGLTWFSNRGIRLDILAPGSDILSLCAEGTNSAPLENHYALMDGTSMAAPHVAGVAALLLSRNPGLSVEAVRQLLRSTAKPDSSDPLVVAGGLGLVDADAALAETRVLEAHLSRPYPGEKITAPIEIQGTIRGQGVAGWELAWGAGRTPSAWHSLQSGTSAVVAGTLATLDPRALPEGVVTLRLSAKDDRGKIYRFDSVVEADFLALQEPALPEFLVYALQFKPGQPIPIKGRVDFGSYVIEMAPGVLPGAGWKTVGGGSGPRNGDLGTWTPDTDLAGGYHTFRIRVEDGSVTRTATTVVRLEPDLISAQWPKFFDHHPNNGLVARRDGNGNVELGAVTTPYLGYTSTGSYHRFTPEGSVLPSVGLKLGGARETPVVAELDSAFPGEEIVFRDDDRILIMNGETLVREIPMGDLWDSEQSLIVANIQGAPALVTVVADRNTDQRSLHVFRPDGTPLKGAFPIACGKISFPLSPEQDTGVLIGDLDGNGTQEFVVLNINETESWSINVYSEDGNPLPWLGKEQPGKMTSMLLADLDRDGWMEIVVTSTEQGYVFKHDGSYFPGWPREELKSGRLACADLDRDGTEEIIAVRYGGGIRVVKPDGSPWSTAWPDWLKVDNDDNSFSFGGYPCVADIDGDGKQEIILSRINWYYSLTDLTKWPDFKYGAGHGRHDLLRSGSGKPGYLRAAPCYDHPPGWHQPW